MLLKLEEVRNYNGKLNIYKVYLNPNCVVRAIPTDIFSTLNPRDNIIDVEGDFSEVVYKEGSEIRRIFVRFHPEELFSRASLLHG